MTGSTEQLQRELQALADTEAAVDDTSCLLRVERPGVGVWEVAAGPIERGGTAASPNSPFRIASITKSFTAAVVLQLVGEGRLGLDDLMAAHLPADLLDIVPRLHVIDGVSYGEQITIRQLLTHSSGLFDYAQSAGFIGAIIENPSRVWTPREMIEGSIVWGTPHFPPGGGYGYAYSDTGYVLLGRVIEHLDGRALHDAYRARVLEPLALHGTYLEGHEAHRGSTLTHTHEGEFDTSPIHGTADWAGGGLVSDTADLAVAARALVDQTLVPEPWSRELLEWRFRTLDPAQHSPGFLGYSCGVEARNVHGVLFRGHRGHWGAWMHVNPSSGLTITGTINQANRRPDRVVAGAVAAALEAGLIERDIA
jgi:D-alanyl-D-alanine carboxypeptidase